MPASVRILFEFVEGFVFFYFLSCRHRARLGHRVLVLASFLRAVAGQVTVRSGQVCYSAKI
jgi:hypothetical protein